jgi:uncharacterized OsmC-like protein
MDLITITRDNGLEFKIRVRGHCVSSDMSESDGGGDGGPSPAELLGVSLGACTAMMAQRYCERHGWEGDAGVNLTLELADNPKRIGRIVKREAVKQVAGRCLIHETLRRPPAVDVDVA